MKPYLEMNLEMKFYRKPSASNVMTNYKLAVTPKRYLIGNIVGEIYRRNNCTTNQTDLNNALPGKFIETEAPQS